MVRHQIFHISPYFKEFHHNVMWPTYTRIKLRMCKFPVIKDLVHFNLLARPWKDRTATYEP